ncbi:MAG: FAD-binding oxidoreductase [Gemmatimonadaceae bacterium]
MAIHGAKSAFPLTDSGGAAARPLVAATSGTWRQAIIERIVVETPTVKSFVLRPLVGAPLLPGQHVDVRLTAADGYQARRSYSVTSSPQTMGTIELAVELLDDGEVSTFLHTVAQVGDSVEVSDAHAEHFVWRSEDAGDVLLIGGGAGVAPLMSILRHRAQIQTAHTMVLLYSARSWAEVIYREELLALERSQPGLRVIFCLTREPAQRPTDFSRRIDAEIVRGALSSLSSLPFLTFICGANRFVGDVADVLLSLGLSPSSIRTERFGGS